MGIFIRISVLTERILLFLLLVFSSLFSFAQTNQVDNQGRKQGEWIKYYPNSKHVEYKGTFTDGQPDGIFYYYFFDGTIKMIAKHDAKTKRSAVYTYYEDKKVKSFGIFNNMKKDSVWTYYSNTGVISKRETYKNNLLNGMSYTYFVNDMKPNSQRIVEEISYVNGKKEGEAKEYFRDGSLETVSHYKNDQLDGAYETYSPGNVKTTLCYFRDGKRHGVATTFINGQPKYTYFWKGEQVKEAKFKTYVKREKAKTN